MDTHEYWPNLNRVDRFDTMDPGWFEAAVEVLLDSEDVEIFDWRPGGKSRLIRVAAREFWPNRPVWPGLKRILRAEGVAASRFKRGRRP